LKDVFNTREICDIATRLVSFFDVDGFDPGGNVLGSAWSPESLVDDTGKIIDTLL